MGMKKSIPIIRERESEAFILGMDGTGNPAHPCLDHLDHLDHMDHLEHFDHLDHLDQEDQKDNLENSQKVCLQQQNLKKKSFLLLP